VTTPLLSICIATYNRANFIGETLASIIPQVTDEVEIVIVDGASTDNTGVIIKQYANTCKQINYIRLPSKGGVDHDYCQAVALAKGKMCWLFPDDDLLKPGAVSAVLKECRRGYSLIVVNAEVMNIDLSQSLLQKMLTINTDEVYDKLYFGQLFDRVIPFISFIGCVVVNRNLWQQREKTRYFGTEFIHVGVIFQSPLPDPALVVATPYITIRYGNAQWWTRAFEVLFFKWPALLQSFESIPEDIRYKHQTRITMRTIAIFRAKGAFTLKSIKKLYAMKDYGLIWKFGALVIAVIPGYVLNMFIMAYYKVLSNASPWTLYDIENSKYNIVKLFKSYTHQ